MKPTKETLDALEKSVSYSSLNINKITQIRDWVIDLNAKLHSKLTLIKLSESNYWYYDTSKSIILNKNQSFFSIQGIQGTVNKSSVNQPIIVQNEVGYLGIITKIFNGCLYFLMQAKIEPGNINKIQISPTIQATKSNFTQKHGGKKPLFLEYFQNVDDYEVLYDGEQSEQCSRFYKKYNRNVIIKIEKDFSIGPRFCWMTVSEVNYLMVNFANLVNMDTRTVLSCLPQSQNMSFENEDSSKAMLYYNYLKESQNRSAIHQNLCPLSSLSNWLVSDSEIRCRTKFPFLIKFFDIEIEDREVSKWTQPLVVADGMALFGTFVRYGKDDLEILIKIKEEIGCENGSLYGPLVQKESTDKIDESILIQKCFKKQLDTNEGVLVDTILSEEGGRFYQEQNRNVIIFANSNAIKTVLPSGYFWVKKSILSELIRYYKVVNIQLRNLYSLLKEKI